MWIKHYDTPKVNVDQKNQFFIRTIKEWHMNTVAGTITETESIKSSKDDIV